MGKPGQSLLLRTEGEGNEPQHPKTMPSETDQGNMFMLMNLLLRFDNVVCTDDVVCITSVQDGTVLGPSESGTWDVFDLLAFFATGVTNSVEFDTGTEIPDNDGGRGSCTQPVTGWGEGKCVDDITGFELFKVLTLGDIPELSGTILTTGCTQGTIRGNSDGVNVTFVTNEVELTSKSLHVPDLDELIPTSRDQNWLFDGWREADARDPVTVTVILCGEGVLALTQSVPDLDGTIAGTRDNLTVICRECNGQNILGVVSETQGGLTFFKVPEAEGTIPGTGKDKETLVVISGQSDIRDEVVVADQTLGWDTVATFSLINIDLPDDDGTITGSGDDVVRELLVGCDCSNSTLVTLEFTAEGKLFK